jgi:uncharacterized protein
MLQPAFGRRELVRASGGGRLAPQKDDDVINIQIVPWYAAALTLLYIGLSARVISGRGLHRINLGSGGIDDMERRIRMHGNFAEYVPLTLLLLLMDELRGLAPLILHLLCLGLLAGRLSHAWGVASAEHHSGFRVGGTALTLGVLGLAALAVPLTTFL